MTTRQGFLDAIAAEPDDDDLRLIFADWLDEQGDPAACEQRLAVALRHVIAEPANDEARLAYAAICEQYGQGERAGFVRLQCRIAALEADCWCRSCVQRRGGGQHTNGPCAVDQARDELPDGRSKQALLRRREGELLYQHKVGWISPFLWEHLRGITNHDGEARLTLHLESGDVGVTFRRGFVAAVTLTLADWCGRACERCGGTGRVQTPLERQRGQRRECPDCRGSGRIAGQGPALVRAAPLERVALERVALSDKRPMRGIATEGFLWGVQDGDVPEWRIPECLANRLDPRRRALSYPTEADAHAALSRACLAFAREPAHA